MSDCPFCDYQGPSEILMDFEVAYVIEPINPVTDGHVLVIPKRHVTSFKSDFATTELTMRCAAAWACGDPFADWNLITSAGEAATQTVKHLHVHLIPRRPGDGLKLPWS